MKKIILFIAAIAIAIVAHASMSGGPTTSCRIEGVPGAYVTAEVQQYSSYGDHKAKVILRCYGVRDAAVTVVLTGENRPANTRNTPFREERMGYMENGKDEVEFRIPSSYYLENVKIYNAVCR